MKKRARLIVIVLLISSMVLSLCGCRKVPTGSGPSATPAPTSGASVRQDIRQLSNKVPAPKGQVGKSAAFTIKADAALSVSGEKDILFEDTVLKVEPVKEPVKELEKPIQALCDSSNYPVGVWKIDGGLEPDEHFPGSYQMTVDLDALGINKSMYDNLVFYRVDEAGNVSEHLYEIQGNKAVIMSSQNSFLVCALLVGVGGTAVMAGPEVVDAEKYFYEKGRSRQAKDGDNDDGKYTIVWSPEDIGYKKDEIQEKVNQKESQCRRNEEARYSDCSWWERLTVNSDIAEAVDKTLAEDEEYQKLIAELETPEIIRLIAEQIDKAYTYLSDVAKVKMPEYRVTFYVRSDISEMGTEITNNYINSIIQIGLGELSGVLTETDGVKRDNLLLTVTHELFHLCQEYYHYKKSAEYNKFDEMVAVVLESDARDYYSENHIISSKPKLTDQNYWTMMVAPIDKTDIDASKAIHQGYNLSLLVMKLREKTGKNVTAEQLMTAHNYYWDAAVTDALMNSFGISEVSFDTIYRSFAVDNRLVAGEYYSTNWAGAEYPQLQHYKLGTEPIHVSISTTEEYWMGIRGFFQPSDDPCALLLVLDDTAATDHPDSNVAPAESFSNTAFGAFIPEKEVEGPSDRCRTILECHGAQGLMQANAQTGYSVIAMYAPVIPRAVVHEGCILVDRPLETRAMSEGYVEGYQLTLYFPDEDDEIAVDVPKDKFTATYSIDLDELLPKELKNATNIELTACEYLTSSKGNQLYGPESKKTKLTLDAQRPEEKKAGSVKIVEDSMYLVLGVELYGQDTIYNDGVTVVKNPDLSLDITIPPLANSNFKGYYDDEHYKFNVSGLSFHAVPDKSAESAWEKHGEYWCSANLTGHSMDFTSIHVSKGRETSKRTGKLSFNADARVCYSEEDGKTYLYLSLPNELEARTTLFASSIPGSTDTTTHSSYSNTLSYECGK